MKVLLLACFGLACTVVTIFWLNQGEPTSQLLYAPVHGAENETEAFVHHVREPWKVRAAIPKSETPELAAPTNILTPTSQGPQSAPNWRTENLHEKSMPSWREASFSHHNNKTRLQDNRTAEAPRPSAQQQTRSIPFTVSSSPSTGPALVNQALRRLERLREQFDFDTAQENRLFELLVRDGNRERVPVSIDGEAFPQFNQQIVDNARSSDDLVRSVLRPEQQEEAEAAWSERDAWWNETVSRIIQSRALVRSEEPEGGIGGTGRSDEVEGGIGGTGRLGTSVFRASSTFTESVLPTFLAIYDLDGDQRLSATEISWMAEQPHGLSEEAVLAFDANADGALSASEAATLHAAHHDHVHLVRQTHFRGADQDADEHLAFAEFIDIPSVTDLYRQDPLATVDAFVALHHEQEAVTIDTFVAAIDASAGVDAATESAVQEDTDLGGAE